MPKPRKQREYLNLTPGQKESIEALLPDAKRLPEFASEDPTRMAFVRAAVVRGLQAMAAEVANSKAGAEVTVA